MSRRKAQNITPQPAPAPSEQSDVRQLSAATPLPSDLSAHIIERGGTRYAVFSFSMKRDEGLRALTPSELAVVELLRKGLSDNAIAAQRGTTRSTITKQVASIFRKLGVRSRRELLAHLG